MKKIELLAPAGDFIKLKTAIDYGADAVYFGGKALSLRVASNNFSYEDMKEGVQYARARRKKCYAALNVIAHNRDLEGIEEYLERLLALKLDGIIVSDIGIMDIIRKTAPSLPIHVSTQANTTNYRAVEFYKSLGVKRIVMARELSLEEIKAISERVPGIELECFVHGAMCISYSGRCLISGYLSGRSANHGDCAQPCRWKYHIAEETRPGEYMPVLENENGTFLFNSKDLCMIEHIGEIIKSGVSSIKIEGRVKSEFYVATVVKAYRQAIDDYYEGRPFNSALLSELKKISHRHYTTGFYFNRPGSEAQGYETSAYVRNYELIGITAGYDEGLRRLRIDLRNRLQKGDDLEILTPEGPCQAISANRITNDKGEDVEIANIPKKIYTIPCETKIPPGSFLRKMKTREE